MRVVGTEGNEYRKTGRYVAEHTFSYRFDSAFSVRYCQEFTIRVHYLKDIFYRSRYCIYSRFTRKTQSLYNLVDEGKKKAPFINSKMLKYVLANKRRESGVRFVYRGFKYNFQGNIKTTEIKINKGGL